jgi:hypothetical protein
MESSSEQASVGHGDLPQPRHNSKSDYGVTQQIQHDTAILRKSLRPAPPTAGGVPGETTDTNSEGVQILPELDIVD